MAFWLSVAIAWGVYCGLTTYGALQFPAYRTTDKIKALLLVWCVPYYGAYRVNRDMGRRIDDATKIELYYELPMWANFGMRVLRDEADD